MSEELREKFNDLIDEFVMNERTLINHFFNILFWKDYQDGHINIDDKMNILEEIRNAKTKNNFLNIEKILPFVNRIRKDIGLKELTLKLNNCLMERTTEVEKELIIRGLE